MCDKSPKYRFDIFDFCFKHLRFNIPRHKTLYTGCNYWCYHLLLICDKCDPNFQYICLLVHSYSETIYLRLILALTKYIKSTCVKFCWGIAIGPLFSAFITLHCFRVLGEPSGWLKARGRGGISTSCWVLREPPIRDRSSMHTGPDSYKQSRITLVLKLNSLMDNLPTPL